MLALVGLVACGSPAEDARETSAKARVKAKSGQVWGRHLAQALGLFEWELCSELGRVDCLGEAHLITLGGVEAQRLGIDEPTPPTASAPIAADRVALAACAERLRLDREGPAVLFGPVLEKGATKGARREVVENLVRRVLSRDPTRSEVDGLVGLYDELEPIAAEPVSDWSVGACMVVATSLEALFY